MSFLSAVTKSELKNSKHQAQQSSEDVLKEFKSFLSDVEDLFHSTTSATGDDLVKAKSQLKQRISTAKETIGDAGDNIFKQARKTAAITNTYVHDQPWKVIGTGIALSFLLGFVLARRD
ncbi:hypothetical protein GCM10011613_16020 [Cellvibrio zantedeschiae]|uniref:DUF883 domain-containing protein n=1 Tax=Cellvibrio zantedeschiae TaxID=1237077 RepID=A0ABQ3AYP2_9GAMM|nr:DUF883 family protein [Cellvibrio zantedeschiae]GGY71912.1 hypothetical protein GCM10011613_16020 [Cellvibrio zantedeschiae]